MKILHITRAIDPSGGCEIYIRNLISILSEDFHQSFVLTALAPTEPLPKSSPSFVIKKLAALDHSNAKASAQELIQVLKIVQPDLIHIHDLNNPYTIEYCGKNYPTVKTTLNADAYCGGIDKYLYTSQKECKFSLGLHCLPIAYYEKCMKRHPRRAIEIISVKLDALKVLDFMSAVIVPSESSRKILTQNRVSNSKIKTIPLFAHFSKDESHASYPKHNPNILFLGRLRPYKGAHFLLKAVAKIRTNCPLFIVGDGEDRPKLETLSSKLGIQNRVRFFGNVPHDQVGQFLDSCSLLAVPSIYPDSFPTVGLEAMRHSRPVVGFQIGGIPEWLTHEKSGFLVKSQDIDGFAEKMDFLIENPDVAERMGQFGYAQYLERFSPDAHRMMINKTYQEAIQSFNKLMTSAR